MKRKHEEALQVARNALKATDLEGGLASDERIVIAGHREHDQWTFEVAARAKGLERQDLAVDANEPLPKHLATIIVRDNSEVGEIVRSNS